MNKSRIAAIVLTMLAAVHAPAQDSFDAVVSTILDNSPELASAEMSARAERLERADENALSNPSVDFSRVWGSRHVGNKLQLDIAQEFEWPGVYTARARAADAALQARTMEIAAARTDKAVEARQLLVELVYVRRQLGVISELRDNFAQLSEAIEMGVRGGELTVIDQRKMQIESYEIDTQAAAVRAREQEIIASLQAMTAVPLDLSEITAYPVQPLLTLAEYEAKAASDPAVVAFSLTAESEGLGERAASMGRYPGFSLGYQHQAEMGDRFNGFTVGVKLPFFGSRNAREAASLRQMAARSEMDNALSARRAQVRGAYAQLQIQRDRLDTYRKVFGDNTYLSLLLKAYKGGQMSVIEYLSEVHYYHQTMLTYLESEYGYNSALTTLNR